MEILVKRKGIALKAEFDKVNYPDGQQQVIIKTKLLADDLVKIKSRLNNWLDLELIVCAVKSLKIAGAKYISLHAPYIMGSRSDRMFSKFDNNYLRDVLCPVLNSLGLESITTLDPHSDVLEACLPNLVGESLLDFHRSAFNKIRKEGDFLVLSPDAGASKKIYKYLEQLNINCDVLTCSKDRGLDGKINKVIVPEVPLGSNVVIIDDIFDRGGTFKAIAKELGSRRHSGKKYLVVTHSIQTDGLKEASEMFTTIYTTNSYKEHNVPKVTEFKVI